MRQRESALTFLIFYEVDIRICIMNTSNFEQSLAKQEYHSSKSNSLLFAQVSQHDSVTSECPHHYCGQQKKELCFSFHLTKKPKCIRRRNLITLTNQKEQGNMHLLVDGNLKLSKKPMNDLFHESCRVYLPLAVLGIYPVLF